MSTNGPPKSILKNRTTSASSSGDRDTNGRSDRNDGKYGYAGFGSGPSGGSIGSGWGGALMSPPLAGASSGDSTSSLLHLESGSDRALLRPKLHEFVSRKRDLLFRPLGSDEVPILETGAQSNTKDHFGVTPSLDFFLKSDIAARRSHFFDTAQAGEIVLAKLTSRTTSGLLLNLVSMEGGRSLFLEELDIMGFCPASQTIPAIHPGNPNKVFTPGDLVRCEILSVKPEDEKVVIGMKGNALSIEMKHSAELGLAFESEVPTAYKIGKRERKSDSDRSYEELLDESLGFHNPNGIACLASQMGILNNRNTLMTGLRGVFPETEMAKSLRRAQNGKWAHGSVAEGIRHFKNGNLTEAFQCLNKALSIDAENVEGLVARGALYANKGGYEKAVEDFETALKHNPNHVNAKKYLAETLVALGKQFEESGKIDDAVGHYGKCLSLRPDHQEAKDAVMSIYTRYEKIDLSKLNPLQRGRIIDLREKLKSMMTLDKAGTKSGAEAESKRKKKAKESSGSSSSSDDSSSDSDERGKKKKKRKKRKKKKSKREGKVKDVEPVEPIQPQLSPFSKRLAESGGVEIMPFKDAGGWGLTTKVVAPPPAPPLEAESKRRKKEKRKKKHRSSDSSSSSSSSDSDRGKRSKTKKKRKASVEALGDLEAKLSAYFSKVEQEKIKEVVPAALSLPTPPPVQTVRRDLNFTVDSHSDKLENRKEPVITRVLPSDSRDLFPVREGKPEANSTESRSRSSSSAEVNRSSSGKIELRTDAYGNFLNQGSETFVRTVLNPAKEEEKPKFEMKIRSQTQQLDPPAQGISDDGAGKGQAEPGSKWRKIGDPTQNPTYTVTRLLDGTPKDKVKPPPPFAPTRPTSATIPPPQGTLYAPPPTRTFVAPSPSPQQKFEQERNYRKNKSRSRSSSSRSRSRSRSPKRGRGRRSRSNSRSRKRSSRSRSRSRSGSWNRSPRRGFGGRYIRGRYARGRGRGGVERVDRVRRIFLGDPPRARRQFPQSRMRNVFAQSRSRSRSRSPTRSRRRSRSTSRTRRDSKKSRSRSKSSSKSSQKMTTPIKEKQDTLKSPGDEHKEEISVGNLTTTKASEVEKLLDQRKAEKKEEMKERNPEFFRNV